MYQADPNNSIKQVPKSRSVDAVGEAVAPSALVIQRRPNHVLINMNGTYAFCYESTASIGGTHADRTNYVTGSMVDDAAGPVRLDINPLSWRQTDAAGTVGDITFVYTGDIG